MGIPENQLEIWTRLGSVRQSSQTYQSIKGILEHERSPYAGRRVDSFLQGSYRNNTNIYADSDVDIVLRTRSLFHFNVDRLPEAQKAKFEEAYPDTAAYILGDFRSEVIAWLNIQFPGELDTSGKKALSLEASGNRRSVDILLVAPHKNYTRFLSTNPGEQSFVEGVYFKSTDGTGTVNYPKQHIDLMVAKHQSTDERLKPTVRVYKNMRKRMVEEGYINVGAAPSYFLEGLLTNVPDDLFGGSLVATVENTFAWIDGNNPSAYMCANGIHPLIRDNSTTSWSSQGYIDWLNAMKLLWINW